MPYIYLYRRLDVLLYLLARAGRIPGLSTDVTSPISNEIKVNGILSIMDIVLNCYKEIAYKTSYSLFYWLKSNHPYTSYLKPFTLVKYTLLIKKY